jgi:hypothetical protein
MQITNWTASAAPVALMLVVVAVLTASGGDEPAAAAPSPITFNLNFEGASLGSIEKLADGTFRCHVEGQHDERGRNRQASWYFFRMDNVKGREIVLTLTDFVGEYNDKPGTCPMGPDIVPVYSDDGTEWKHFERCEWDDDKKEATLRFRPEAQSIWIAHIPPYTAGDLERLLGEIEKSPFATVEVIGKTVGGREIPMVSVTDLGTSDGGKKVLWLQARQHAWEAGTSYVIEGALRFITSDEPSAKALREKVVFKFTPMVDVDGCAAGRVRFNGNNYDVNRHWSEVDLRRPEMLKLMPEIWYTKKAIIGMGSKIDLMVNLHNTETAEYVATMVDDAAVLERMKRFEKVLGEKTSFDPSKPLSVVKAPPAGDDDTNSLWAQHRVPVMLMEQRIATSKKLGRRAEVEDRLRFGRELVEAMGEAVGP